ncbi:MAG: archaellin/type IV pilin N-terminal domain-containing protein [Nanoarchaeota archaeon]
MLLGKKGVSPLIATVLLISFAVALGAVVMNWAGSIAHGQSCEGVNFKVVERNGGLAICYDPSGEQVIMTVQNVGKALEGVQFESKGEKGVHPSSSMIPMQEGETRDLKAPYSERDFGSLVGVSVVPVTGEDAEHVSPCDQFGIEYSAIAQCAS